MEETDLKAEFEGISEESRKQASKSIIDESSSKLLGRLSFDYYEIDEPIDNSTNTSLLSKEKCFELMKSENIEETDESIPSTPILNPNQTINENIALTPKVKVTRKINMSLTHNKKEEIKNTITKAVNMITEKNIKGVVELIKDYKDGFIEKYSKSLLSPWKPKYCRVNNFQFVAYKTFDSGWVSIFIDFKQVGVKLDISKENKQFM